VKPVGDILKSLIAPVLGENQEVMAVLRGDDPDRDLLGAFLENTRNQVVPEAVASQVLETIAGRAGLLVNTCIQSPTEFWKCWTSFMPLVADCQEQSPVFESTCFFLRRLGERMRESASAHAQQLFLDVALPSLALILQESAGKREPLCDIIYAFTMDYTAQHLHVLRTIKEHIPKLPAYICCLSYLASLEGPSNLGDDNMLDLYLYYALIALSHTQPKVRVAGLAILQQCAALSPDAVSRGVGSSTMGRVVPPHQTVAQLAPVICSFKSDPWWEMNAHVLLLVSTLVRQLAEWRRWEDVMTEASEMDDEGGTAEHSTTLSVAQSVGEGSAAEGKARAPTSAMEDTFLNTIADVFRPSANQHVKQVGLVCVAPILSHHPGLIGPYLNVLLSQPSHLRMRLLQPMEQKPDGEEAAPNRIVYVFGSSSRYYEERCICDLWPAVEVARVFVGSLQALAPSRFEAEHVETLSALIRSPTSNVGQHQDVWIDVFDKVKAYVFVAFVDSQLHTAAAELVQSFLLSPVPEVASHCLGASQKTLVQTLRLFYSNADRQMVSEADLVNFLKLLRGANENARAALDAVISQFRIAHAAEYERSMLRNI